MFCPKLSDRSVQAMSTSLKSGVPLLVVAIVAHGLIEHHAGDISFYLVWRFRGPNPLETFTISAIGRAAVVEILEAQRRWARCLCKLPLN